jgi:Mrp family chromosome partitioning ATPase
MSHRVNYSDDEVLSGARAGIVGMLPDLGNSLDDQELASASAFAVHQIRSQLQIKNTEEKSRVFGVTSPAPGDGKTSLIIAMGLSFAESGNRTLLVDLDFIGRGLSVHFGHTRAPSLADRLTESEEVSQLVHETEFPGLSILPAGYGDDLRVSKLSPRSLEALLAPLRENFDTILVDTGPILGSVEAAFVAPQADGVLLVVGRGQF